MAEFQLLHVVSFLELGEALSLLRGVILLLLIYDGTGASSIVEVVVIPRDLLCLLIIIHILRLHGLLRAEVFIYDHFFLNNVLLRLNIQYHLQTVLLLLQGADLHSFVAVLSGLGHLVIGLGVLVGDG